MSAISTASAVLRKSALAVAGAATLASVPAIIDAGQSKAVLYLEVIPLAGSPQSTKFKLLGKLDRALAAQGFNATAGGVTTRNIIGNTGGASTGPGINTSQDIVRFTGNTSSQAYVQYRIARNIGGTVVACGASSSNCNIFTATSGGNTLSVTNPAPIYTPSPNSFSYISLFSGALSNATGGTFGIVNSYTSNTEILNEFIINRSVASLGFDTTQRYEFIIGGETLIIGTNQVPAPLPLLGAGAAFGFSRKLRSRIRLQKSSTEPTAS